MDSAALAATLGEEELPVVAVFSSVAAAAAGGVVPLGSEFPFRRKTSAVGVVSALLPSPALSPPARFMLLMRSRTELFLAAGTGAAIEDEVALVVVVEVVLAVLAFVVSCCSGAAPELAASAEDFITDVISPDFRSTPTMDHGRGLGSGFGFGTPATAGGSAALSEGGSEGRLDDGRDVENLVALRPTMEPPLAVGEVAGTPPPATRDALSSVEDGPTSDVGDVSDPASPVDLFLGVASNSKAPLQDGQELIISYGTD